MLAYQEFLAVTGNSVMMTIGRISGLSGSTQGLFLGPEPMNQPQGLSTQPLGGKSSRETGDGLEAMGVDPARRRANQE